MAKRKDLRKNKTPPPPKKPGAVDRVPGQRKVKASIRGIMQDIAEHHEKTIRDCIMQGLKASPRDAHHYLKLALEYVDGKPDSNLNIKFNEDELATAKATLHQKLSIVLERVVVPAETTHET